MSPVISFSPALYIYVIIQIYLQLIKSNQIKLDESITNIYSTVFDL